VGTVIHIDVDLNPIRTKDGRFGDKASKFDPMTSAKTRLSNQFSELRKMEKEEAGMEKGSPAHMRKVAAIEKKQQAIKETQDMMERLKAEPVQANKPKEPEPPPPPKVDPLEKLNIPQQVKDIQKDFPELSPEFESAIKDGIVSMRVHTSSLVGIKTRGEFLNQQEIAKSGGHYEPAYRKRFEDTLMGINSDDKKAYPKYGYLDIDKKAHLSSGAFGALSGASHILDQYGLVTVHFNPRIKERTTVSFGDSLDGLRGHLGSTKPFAQTTTSPAQFLGHVTPILAPKNTEVRFWDNPEVEKPEMRNPVVHAYTETQVYGKLSTGDIAGFRVYGSAQKEKIEKLFPGVPVKAQKQRLSKELLPEYLAGSPASELVTYSPDTRKRIASRVGATYAPNHQLKRPNSVLESEFLKMDAPSQAAHLEKMNKSLVEEFSNPKINHFSLKMEQVNPSKWMGNAERNKAEKIHFKELQSSIMKTDKLRKELGALLSPEED